MSYYYLIEGELDFVGVELYLRVVLLGDVEATDKYLKEIFVSEKWQFCLLLFLCWLNALGFFPP